MPSVKAVLRRSTKLHSVAEHRTVRRRPSWTTLHILVSILSLSPLSQSLKKKSVHSSVFEFVYCIFCPCPELK